MDTTVDSQKKEQEKELLKLLETDSSRVIANMSFDCPYPAYMRAARGLELYCAEVIAKFTHIIPELKHELKESLELAMEECPPSLLGRGRKILKRIGA